MSQPSVKSDAEIRLLTEMLADLDGADHRNTGRDGIEDDLYPDEPGAATSAGCPAPAVLWALFEPAAEDAAWTARMRNHVEQCPSCGLLTRRLKGFVAASEDRSSLNEEYEAAWKSAEKRMERNFHNALEMKAKAEPKAEPKPFWKFRWLPSMPVAYAMGGCAAVLLLLSGITLFNAGSKPEADPNQLAQANADIWSQPSAPQDQSAVPQDQPPDGSEPAANAATPATGPAAAGAPAVEPQPTSIPPGPGQSGPGQPGRPEPAPKARESELPALAPGAIAASSEAVNPAIHTVSMQLTAGMNATVQILLVRHEAAGTSIEGALTPVSSPGSPSAIFSAHLEGSGPLRLRIQTLEQNGKRTRIQGGDVSAVTVVWPEAERKPLPGQSFEIRVLTGARLTSEGESK